MTTAKLIIDGKEIKVQISDEQIQELTKPKKVTGFERAELGGTYWLITKDGDICSYTENHLLNDDHNYDSSNYYTDVVLAEWCSRNDTLNYKMRRWAAEHNTHSFDWNDPNNIGFHISYELETSSSFKIYHSYHGHLHESVYFATEEIAEEAIKVFGDEIKWLAQNRPKWF